MHRKRFFFAEWMMQKYYQYVLISFFEEAQKKIYIADGILHLILKNPDT